MIKVYSILISKKVKDVKSWESAQNAFFRNTMFQLITIVKTFF